MKSSRLRSDLLCRFFGSSLLVLSSFCQFAPAQNSIQQRLAQVKEAAAQNKEALAHYTWQEQQTVALKGDIKDTKLFQVRIGPDGTPQKTELENTAAASEGGGRLKRHIVEKKKEEFEEYGQQIGALAHQYTKPDPERLQQAYQQGNVMLGAAQASGEVKMVISSYIKPNDRVTITFNQQTKTIQSLDVDTYLNDPSDAVKIKAQFSQLPDGTNHVATMQVNGVSKQLLVSMQNSNYQKSM